MKWTDVRTRTVLYASHFHILETSHTTGSGTHNCVTQRTKQQQQHKKKNNIWLRFFILNKQEEKEILLDHRPAVF